MVRISAGLVIYRIKREIEIFLVHNGGPFWKNKDEGSWSIPKGEINDGEDLLEAAKRELYEETSISAPEDKSKFIYLDTIKTAGGKLIHAWAFEGDWNGLLICRSYVTIENPQNSGKLIKFPEVDKAKFFNIKEAKKKINNKQLAFIERLEKIIK